MDAVLARPEPETVAYLGLEPVDIMMVTSHKYDIRAAVRRVANRFHRPPAGVRVGCAAQLTFDEEFDITLTI